MSRTRYGCVAIVPAGGAGSRFGADRPKQYLSLGRITVLGATLKALLTAPEIEHVYVNVQAGDPYAQEVVDALAPHEAARVSLLRTAGPTRAATVLAALECIAHEVRLDAWVLVHDAARPCLSAAALARLLAVRAEVDTGALLALPVADTVKRADGCGHVAETVPRDALWRAQTPQMFRYGVLCDALAACPDATDEAQAVEALGLAPKLVLGEARNQKVTHPEDLPLARFFMEKA
ncbi:MAG: 2-C-methyl-D-erythritol 4-phosphate cytidylyltransferase [Casimicrobiaceae bacterium]